MIPYLDCSDYETTLESISNILEIDKKSIIKSVKKNNEDIIKEKFSNKNYYCCFFHATRIFNDQEFNNGLKPLGEIIDYIWERLGVLISGDLKQWDDFRNKMDNNYFEYYHNRLYYDRLLDNNQHGPYGYLIKDVIDNPDGPVNIDYFNAPEIVDDICLTYEEYNRFNLFEKYHKISVPAIIKFRYKTNELCYIKEALNYLKKCILKQDDSPLDKGKFTGREGRILKDDILEIEIIKNWKKKVFIKNE